MAQPRLFFITDADIAGHSYSSVANDSRQGSFIMNTSSWLTRGTLGAIAAVPLFLIGCGGSPETTGQSSAAESTGGTAPKDPSTGLVTPIVCKGPLPDVCEVCKDGKSECAHWVDVHGKCEVEICPDASTTPPPPPSPTPVCTGGLPDICEICADGKSECAHWVYVDGKC